LICDAKGYGNNRYDWVKHGVGMTELGVPVGHDLARH